MEGPADLPPLGAEESESLDFKSEGYDGGERGCIEIARDVAQFASRLGGTLLLGAMEVDGRLSGYVPVPDLETQKMRISDACNDRLDPRVSIVLNEIAHSPGIPVLAVNTQPSPSVVGVRVFDGRWEFPLRVGKSRVFLRPSEVESMLSHERRVQLLLESIPPESRQNVVIDARRLRSGGYSLEEIGARHSTFKAPGRGIIFHVPHAFVEAVWPSDPHGQYAVSIDAFLEVHQGPLAIIVRRHEK